MEEKKNLLCVGKEKKTIQNVVGIEKKSKLSFLNITIILVSILSFASPSFLEVIVMCFGSFICSGFIEFH